LTIQTDIRKLYNPIQPAVKQAGESVNYREIAPQPKLQSFIYCYWQLHTHEPLSDVFSYRVVADGCIDIFFELSNPEENFVMGFCKKFTMFPLEKTFNYVGVRFLPTMFPQLFKINASELSNQFLALNSVIPSLARFIGQHFNSKQSLADIQIIFDRYFYRHISSITVDFDPRLYQAIDIILNRMGLVDIEKDLDTGLSSRQLRRLFEFYIGDTAKIFSQVVRFQNILKAKPSSQSLKQNKLFLNEGYYDQAHFIKAFKHFYGVTPNQAFGR